MIYCSLMMERMNHSAVICTNQLQMHLFKHVLLLPAQSKQANMDKIPKFIRLGVNVPPGVN